MNPKDIITTWQKPIYNLAYRFLGNEADASDATQETFATALKNLHRYDSSRDFKPWIYQVGMNVLYNYARDQKTRAKKENEFAMKEEPSIENLDLEHKETQALVWQHVCNLPAEAKAAIVLHYYQGLSQSDAAESLAIPRTTFQSRLDKGLESLKKNLASSGCLAVVPVVESLMSSTAPVAVPAKLSASLIGLTATTASVSAATGVGIGGLLVSKQIVATLVIVGIASVGVGIFAGKALWNGESKSPKVNPAEYVSRKDLEQLQNENASLSSKVRALESELQASKESAHSRQAVATESMKATPKNAETTQAAAASAKTSQNSGIDWEKFSTALAANLELFLKETSGSEEEPTVEEKAKMMLVLGELMSVIKQAKDITPTPLFDSKLYPEIMQAIYAKTLKLTPEQVTQLRGLSESALAQTVGNFSATNALPIEVWEKRMRLIEQFNTSMPSILNPDQKQLWNRMLPGTDHLSQSDQSVIEFGYGDPKEGPAQEKILREWKRCYGLDEGQANLAKDLANSFFEESKKLLSSQDPEVRAQAKANMLYLQIQREREIFAMLTPQQKEAALKRTPTILRFHPGQGQNTSTRRGGISF